MKKKSQVSMEFVMIVILAIFIITIPFLAFIQYQSNEFNERTDYSSMEDLASSIKSEVVSATLVKDNYLRKFKIPYMINKKGYTITLNKNILFIKNEEDKEVVEILPVEVSGGFAKPEQNALLYCITKNDEEVRISKNQVSIEPDLPIENESYNSLINNDFSVYIRINCLDNVQKIQFILLFEPDYLEYLNYEVLYQKNWDGSSTSMLNPFFETEPDELQFGSSYFDPANGMVIFGFIGEKQSGSGNVMKIVFRTKKNGSTYIKFKKDSLMIYNPSDKIETSYKDAFINILS